MIRPHTPAKRVVVTMLALAFATLGSATLDFEAQAKPARRATRPQPKRPAPAPAPAATRPATAEPPRDAPASDLVPQTDFRGPTRIDFDDRLIQGQTNKSGAVYLFDRKETGISSMVRRRKSFRQLTIATIFDR